MLDHQINFWPAWSNSTGGRCISGYCTSFLNNIILRWVISNTRLWVRPNRDLHLGQLCVSATTSDHDVSRNIYNQLLVGSHILKSLTLNSFLWAVTAFSCNMDRWRFGPAGLSLYFHLILGKWNSLQGSNDEQRSKFIWSDHKNTTQTPPRRLI